MSDLRIIDVIRVVDGDTVVVRNESGLQERVRLYGIDTPELDQPYGNESTRALSNLVLAPNARVRIERTGVDRYRRTVARLYVQTSPSMAWMDVQSEMLRGGHAWWYERYAPNDTLYAEAHHIARESRTGLWSFEENAIIDPQKWRKRHGAIRKGLLAASTVMESSGATPIGANVADWYAWKRRERHDHSFGHFVCGCFH